MPISIRPAVAADAPLILTFIRGLAEYEKLTHEVVATEEKLRTTLFPADHPPAAECRIADLDGAPAGFALFFTNYSTFLARPGLYLEDLFVLPALRGRGVGKALLLHLAQLANARGYGNEPAIAFYESIGAVRKTEWQICRLTGPALAQYR